MANKIVTDGETYGISPDQSYNRCVSERDADADGSYFDFLQYDGGGRISLDSGTNDTYVYRNTVKNVNTYLGKHQLVKGGKFSPYEEHRLITEDKLDNCFLNYDKSLQFAPEVFVPGTSFWKNVANNATTIYNAGNYVTNQTVYESYARYGLGTEDMYCYMFYPKYPFDDVMNDWQTYVDYAYYDSDGIDGEFLNSSVNMSWARYYNRSTSIVIGSGTTNRVCSYKSNYFKYYPGNYFSEWMDQTDIIYVYPAFITKIKIPCFWAGNDYSLVNYYSAYSNDAYSIFYFHFLKDHPANFNESTSSTYCALYESGAINSVYVEDFELKINGNWYNINGWYTCC